MPAFLLLIDNFDSKPAEGLCHAKFDLYEWQLLVIKTMFLS